MTPHSLVSLVVTSCLLLAIPTPVLTASTRLHPGEAEPSAITASPLRCFPISHTTSPIAGTYGPCDSYSLWQVFDLEAEGIREMYTVRSVDIGIFQATGVSHITVRLYAQTGAAFPGGTRTLVGTGTGPVEAGSGFTATVNVIGTLPRLSTLVVEVARETTGTGSFRPGFCSLPEGTTYASSASCAIGPTPTLLSGHLALTVNGCTNLLTQTHVPDGTFVPFVCLDGGFNSGYELFRAFDLPALGVDDPVNVTGINVAIAGANAGGTATSQPLVVSLYAYDTPSLPADLGSPLSTRAVTVADQGSGVITIPITGTIRRGSRLAVGLRVPSGVADQNYLAFGRVRTGEIAPVYLSSILCAGSAAPVGIPFPGLLIDVIASTTSLSQHTDLPIDGGSSCEHNGVLLETSFLRAFDLPALGVTGPYVVESVDAGVGFVQLATATTLRYTVNVYANTDGPFPAGTRTLVGTGEAVVPIASSGTVNVPVHAIVPTGAELVVEVSRSTDHPPGTFFSIGTNSFPQTAPTYVYSPACSGPTVIPVQHASLVLTVNGAPWCGSGLPSDVETFVGPNECGAAVTYATPDSGASCGTVVCAPASGSVFPVGTTTVTCTIDGAPAHAFAVTVVDLTPLAVLCPGDIVTRPDGSSCAAVVTYSAGVVNACSAAQITCTPPSGSPFPVGTTTVTCVADDASTATAACSFAVTVEDVVPPAFECPSDVMVPVDSPFGSNVSFPYHVSDCQPVAVTCQPQEGSLFPIGVTPVTCTATDPSGNSNSCSFDVYVGIPGTFDGVGLYATSTNAAFLRDQPSSGPADLVFTFGGAPVTAITGDWDGDGVDSLGIYVAATGAFFLRNGNAPGPADAVFTFGASGAGLVPLSGDWNGDGVDTVGLFNPATCAFFLRNTNTPGPADLVFTFGAPGAGLRPIVGDWNATGVDTVGVYNPSTGGFHLRFANAGGLANLAFGFGGPGAGLVAIAGDWNADGADTIGLYNPSTGAFFLRNTNSDGAADLAFTFGTGGPGLQPLVGDWDGN